MKDKYIIINLKTMDYMKDKDGNINFYNTEGEACQVCGMYEFENVWVCKLVYNHIEEIVMKQENKIVENESIQRIKKMCGIIKNVKTNSELKRCL